MLTPQDHAKLLSLTTLPVLTPEDAKFIHRCMPSNSWLTHSTIKWWYPISDTGHAVPNGERYEHMIRKPTVPRPINPSSIEQQQPWVQAGISRATWYQQRAAEPHYAAILAALPDSVDKSEGLKLYRALARFAVTHKLKINELWGEVCDAVTKLTRLI